MQLSELEILVGNLTGDPNHDRYSLSDIHTELDNTMGQWNQEIKLITETTLIPAVSGQRQYLLSLITGTPIAFPRATFRGIDMKKRSKSYFDLYSSTDWTLFQGTPTDFYIEATDPANAYLTVFPVPQGNDAGGIIAAEAVIAHTSMVNPTDVPFMSGTASNYLLRPFDFYVAYSAAARLLARDPSPINQPKAGEYLKIAGEGKELITNVFKQLERDEPDRLKGGRYWNFPTGLMVK